MYRYGWNDGSIAPTRGGQFRFYGGLVAKYKFLTLQFRPEVVYASNQKYDDAGNTPGYGLEWYKAIGNVIDMPEYFGKSAYTRALLGQTSLKATFGAVSFGFSTENLYWGPGCYNALLMSNNAQGFPHFTVHTSKPVQTANGEYAKNDHNWDARDGMAQMDHTRAYTFGLRKLIPLQNRWGGYLQLAGEMTQIAVTNTRGIRSAGPWYVHNRVSDGYTHRGQLLGAGIGVGSNSQTVQASWVDGLKQLGVQVQRLVHNEDFAIYEKKDFRNNWVDASVAAYGTWDYKQFIFNAHLQYIHAYNYQYNFQASEDRDDFWGFDPQDKNNLHLKFGVMYRF